MYNGTPLLERIKRLVEAQMTTLESWAESGGLAPEHLDQLKALAMISRQLDLDNVEDTQPRSGPAADSVPVEDLLAQIPKK